MTRAGCLLLLSIGFSGAAHGESETHTRLTIRGTGSDISVERSEALTAARKPELSRTNPEPTVLAEAIRMKQAGSTDEAIVRYLKRRSARLPVVVDLDTVRQLRAAGAGKSVVRYLASVSAIEIGESGAVGSAAAEYAPSVESSEPAFAGPAYDSGFVGSYGYPGVYSLPSFRAPGSMRIHRIPAFRQPIPTMRTQPGRFRPFR